MSFPFQHLAKGGAVVAAALALSACDISPPSEAGNVPGSSPEVETELQTPLAQTHATPTPALSQVMLWLDQTGSMNSARVALLTYSDVQPVLEAMSQTGGTFAVGAICDDSNRPLTRITFTEPPQLDQATLPTPPERPDTSQGNAFKNRQRLEKYEEEKAAYEEQATSIQQEIAAYEQQREEHQAENNQRIAEIQPEIEAILNQPRNCQNTDIQQAVQRTNWFFAEPGIWSESPRTYVVFITDGLDSFSNEPVELEAETVLLVNGSGDMGVFQSIDHQRFESPSAALKVLAQWMQE